MVSNGMRTKISAVKDTHPGISHTAALRLVEAAHTLRDEDPALSYDEALAEVLAGHVPAAPAPPAPSTRPRLAFGMLAGTPHVVSFDPAGHLGIFGTYGTGATTTCIALARCAVDLGFELSFFSPGHPLDPHSAGDLIDPAEAQASRIRTFQGPEHPDAASEAAFIDSVLALRPGSADRPHLIVLDEITRFFPPRLVNAQAEEQPAWLRHLVSLMGTRHTTVAIRAVRPREVPLPLEELLENRVVMGKASTQEYLLSLPQAQEALQPHLDDFAWRPIPTGQGVFWDTASVNVVFVPDARGRAYAASLMNQ